MEIFRNTPLPTEQQPHQYQRSAAIPPLPTPYSQPTSTHADPSPDIVCYFFNKGLCKYGRTCKNLHTKPSTTTNGYHTASTSDGKDWRKDSKPNTPTSQSHESLGGAGQPTPDFETLLPRKNDIPINTLPINKNQQRLDYYVPRTSPEDHAAFVARAART